MSRTGRAEDNNSLRWMGVPLRVTGGLYNDRSVDHFIAVKHAWADAAVRGLAATGSAAVRVLETHAGYGWLTTTYALAGATVTAIERDGAAVACLRANTTDLPVEVFHADAARCPLVEEFDIIDVDATGSPQPVLDAVLRRHQPRILFVTFGEALFFRIRRETCHATGIRLYGDTWRAHQHELGSGSVHNFGRVIGFNHIRRAWPDAELLGYHAWPRSGSSRVAVGRGIQLAMPDVAASVAWASAQLGRESA